MDAVQRGREMLYIPIRDLPPLATKFANYLCNQVGMCLEVYLTVYAQCVEGLKCDDELYKARREHIYWFLVNNLDTTA